MSPFESIGTDHFAIELKILPRAVGSPADTETIFQHGSTTSSPQSRSIRIDRYGNSFKLYISSDGLTYNIANGETATSGNVFISSDNTFEVTSPLTAVTLVLEKYEKQWTLRVNGNQAIRCLTPSTSPETYNGPYPALGDWQLGTGDGGDFTGEIIAARLTAGFYRYGGYVTVDNSISIPWADFGKYNTYAVYTNKPALAWKDLAENQFFGLGATTTGVTEAVAYGDELMDCGEARCRIGLAITDPRRVEQHLDLLATYSNCLWFPEGSDLKIRPDAIAGENATGSTEVVVDGGFDGSPVTAWDAGSPEGWTISGGVATGDGGFTQTLSQTVTVETGGRYQLSFDVATTSPLASGSLSVEVDSVALSGLATGITAAGSYKGYFTATSTSALIEFLGVTWTGSIDNVSIVPAFYQITADKISQR